jgi:3-oxoacyl-[acyl-carrier protein] reductase
MKRFENQSAIITGGAEGIGRGIAERIASEGGKVFLFDINQPMLEKTIQDLKIRDLMWRVCW